MCFYGVKQIGEISNYLKPNKTTIKSISKVLVMPCSEKKPVVYKMKRTIYPYPNDPVFNVHKN